MAQRTLFAALPNTQPIAYYQTLTLIFGEVKRTSPQPKALRDFLKLRNIFDKETWPVLSAVLELKDDGTAVTMSDFGKKVLEADDDVAGRETIARHLIALNPLMAKYCLEALDTEHGGRLHSTNEFYRMLTSFVYPGEKPTLTSFKAWVEWAVGANLLKLVGVRWAIGEVGLRELPRLRALDSEEFMEEELAAASATAEAEAAAATDAETAAPIEDEAAVAPASDESIAPAPSTPQAAAPSRPQKTTPPTRPAERIHVAPAQIKASDLDTTRDLLVTWHDQFVGRSTITARRVGLDPLRKSPALTYEMAFAALLLGRGIAPETVQTVFDAFRGPGLLLNMGKGKFPSDGFASLMSRSTDRAFVAACEAAIHLPRLFKVTTDPMPLVTGSDPREFAWNLYRRLYEPVAPLAPFYLARFLWEASMVPADLAAVALVPTDVVRENAFRIGFVDRLYCASFGDLLDVALQLADRFGPPGFEGPLAQTHEGFGCAFRCSRVASCPLSCREKGEIGRKGPA